MEQANVQLSISSEATEAVRGLAKLEQGEKSFETAVKVGNKTLKGRTDTLGGVAQLTAKVEAIERKAATATQKRAAASLAAQKSAALLAEWTKKQANEARIATGWEAALAKAQLQADAANQARLRKRVEESTKATQLQKGAMLGALKSAASYAGGLAGIGSAAAIATAAIRTLIQEQEHQKELGRESDKAAAGLKEFVALQKPGEEGRKHVQDTVIRGARMGLTPEQVAAIAQPIQSVTDVNGDGVLDEKERKNFEEDTTAGFTLSQLDVAPEDIAQVITAGRSLGRGGKESADKLIAASDLSVAGPADFARAASAMAQFQDQDTALAVTTAMTREGTPLEQLPTLVRGAALTLGSSNDDSKFSKEFGLKGLSEAEKIQRLREIGAERGDGATEDERIANFSRSLKNYDLDEEKARAVGLLVRQADTVESTRKVLSDLAPGVAEGKVASVLEDPAQRGAMVSKQAEALGQATDLYGPNAQKGRDANEEAQARGAILKKYGGEQAVDESGAMKSIASFDTIIGLFKAAINGMRLGPAEAGARPGTDQDVNRSLDDLAQALRENTAATQANSGATKRTTPVGGNPANAEEKY